MNLCVHPKNNIFFKEDEETELAKKIMQFKEVLKDSIQ
jgi:arginyl-tRNA synthetase